MPISSSIVNWITMAVTDRAPYVLDPSPILCHNITVNIFPSALKHGIEPDDAMYVVEHPLRDLVLREDPLKVLYLGVSPDGLPWRWWWPTHRGGRRSSMRCA